MRATSRARKHPSTTIPPKPHKTNLGSTSTALQQCTMAHLLVLLRQASKVASTSASRCSDSQQLAQNSDDLDTLTTALESVAAELPLDASWETTCTLWEAAWVCQTTSTPPNPELPQVATKMEHLASMLWKLSIEPAFAQCPSSPQQLAYLANAGRQRYSAGHYQSAEMLLAAAMSCIEAQMHNKSVHTTPTRHAHLVFDVLLHRYGCAVRLGLKVLAGNLQRQLLDAHKHLRDAAASRSMITMMLSLATTADTPAARLQLLRLALHANEDAKKGSQRQGDIQDCHVQHSPSNTQTRYLDVGLAIKTLQSLASAHLAAGEDGNASDAAHTAWELMQHHAMQHGVDASDMLVWAIQMQVDAQHKQRCANLLTTLQHGSGICASIVRAPPPNPTLLDLLQRVAASPRTCDALHTALPHVVRTLGYHAVCVVQCATSALQPISKSTAWSAHIDTLVTCTLNVLRQEPVTTCITRDPHHQATCYALLCNTAKSILSLLTSPHRSTDARACITTAQQLLHGAMHVAPTPGERAVAALHVAACLGMLGEWQAAQEYVKLHDEHQGATPADTHLQLLLHLHAGGVVLGGMAEEDGVGSINNSNMPLPLDVLRCAVHTILPGLSSCQEQNPLSDPEKIAYVIKLLLQGFARTPELKLHANSALPAHQRLQLWQALLALTLMVMTETSSHDDNEEKKNKGRSNTHNNTSEKTAALLPHVAHVSLECSKWAVKLVGSRVIQQQQKALRGALGNIALMGYQCGLRVLQCKVPRAAVPLLTASAAVYGLLGGFENAACKKTALLVALEASFMLPRLPPGIVAILNLASNIELGPLAYEQGGRLLVSIVPQLHAMLATELHDETMQLDAIAAAVNTDSIDPPRLAFLVLNCGLHMTQRVAMAACQAVLRVMCLRGSVQDIALMVGVVHRVLTTVDKSQHRVRLLEDAVAAVEEVHQRGGGVKLDNDAALQWLAGTVVGELRQRVLRCVGEQEELSTCASIWSAADSLLGSLADEMGV